MLAPQHDGNKDQRILYDFSVGTQGLTIRQEGWLNRALQTLHKFDGYIKKEKLERKDQSIDQHSSGNEQISHLQNIKNVVNIT